MPASREAAVPQDLPDDQVTTSSHRIMDFCDSKVVTFLVDGFTIIFTAALAYILHFTELISVVIRSMKCSDESISHQLKPEILNDYQIHFFKKFRDENLFQATFFLPFAIIFLTEIILSFYEPVYKSLKKITTSLIVQTVKISSAFTIGYLVIVIIVNILQKSSGKLRPNFLQSCPAPCTGYDLYPELMADELSYCFGINRTFDHMFNSSHSILVTRTKDGRKSFPSFSVSVASYTAMFVVLLFHQPKMRRHLSWASSARAMLSAFTFIFVTLLANTQLITNRNHIEDILTAIFLGFSVAFYIITAHVELYKSPVQLRNISQDQEGFGVRRCDRVTDLSDSSKCKSIDYFSIPRVVYRGSIRWSKKWKARNTTSNCSQHQLNEIRSTTSASSSGIANPIFRVPSSEFMNNQTRSNASDPRFFN